jgi:hypothetical protein
MQSIEEFIEDNEQGLNISKDTCNLLSRINRARRAIYTAGDYEGTMAHGAIRIGCNKCVYLPYELETIRTATTGCQHVVVERASYCSVAPEQYCKCGCDNKELTIVKTGRQNPLPFEMPTNSARLGFSAVSSMDNGKKMKIRYISSSGTEAINEGVLNRDEVFTTSSAVASVISLHKQTTLNNVSVLLLPPDSDDGRIVHCLHPREVNPMYSQYSLKGCVCECIVIYGKKRFVPFEEGTDLSETMIELNPVAVANVMKALSFFDKGSKEDIVLYKEWMKLAIELLKLDKVDKQSSYDGGKVVSFNPEISLGANYEY